MKQTNRKTHRHTRLNLMWGEEYSYYERNRQLAKAHKLMEEHHHERKPGK